jgi:endonuclease YncB( thermonuclease family)
MIQFTFSIFSLAVLFYLSMIGAENVFSLSECTGHAVCFKGNITKVVDGDTIDVNGARIRLSLIDTPEIGHQNYTEAKNFALNLCPFGSIALVDQDDNQLGGSHGRMIGLVYCKDHAGNFTASLDELMLDKGYASILPKQCTKSEFSGELWAQKYGCKES